MGKRFYFIGNASAFSNILLLLFYSNFTKVRFLILHVMLMISHVKQIKNKTWRNY